MGHASPFSIDFELSQFSFLRRSNPSGAFAELFNRIENMIDADEKFARAFSNFQLNFKGVGLAQRDAARFTDCKKKGAKKLKIKVGALPLELSPGLALMYDATLEQLRTSDERIEPELFDARTVQVLARHLPDILPNIGANTVTALEHALADPDYADKLRLRAEELSVAYVDDFTPLPGSCEFCEIQITDSDGKIVDRRCGSEKECKSVGILLIVFAAIAALKWLGGLFDWW